MLSERKRFNYMINTPRESSSKKTYNSTAFKPANANIQQIDSMQSSKVK
jgi:hypothetical protein